MNKINWKNVMVFFLGMLIFAVGSFLARTIIFVRPPSPDGIIEDWERICFWSDAGGIYAAISPKGCYSSTCTRPEYKAGTAIVDARDYKIQLESRFVLVKTSRFPLPCSENCVGGGTVQFNLGPLIPNNYVVWFRDEQIGELNVYSGRETPRQCITRTQGDS